ncbi:MAG: NUDIX domain-containing protein [Verrucomicrobia bacterium]|nr:NUDIX domain-containing protein [Verrucomicrobiota bacterium]
MRPIKHIRTAARAIIICEGKLLVVKMSDRRGVYYILPGGGQQPGETLEIALRRECLEEVGLEVQVGPLLYVREYIGRNHSFSQKHTGFHQLEHVFRCSVKNPQAAAPGCETDNHQIGVSWLQLSHLPNVRFYPDCIKQWFTEDGFECPVQYLGDCN